MESNSGAEGLRQRQRQQPDAGPAREAEGANARPARSVTETAKETATETAKETTKGVHAQVAAAQVVDILTVLLFFRFANALCVRTFFQPDEYFQALEPAWDIAFGRDSGAWLTWVGIFLLFCFDCVLS